jgi:hypothetical protein
MFYKKEDVNEVTTCLVCSKIYIDPRILPCGESACYKCIQDLSNKRNEFNCKLCNGKHTPASREGFPVNRPLLKLLGVKAERVSTNPRVNELKTKLEQAETKCDKFKLDLNKGVDQISEHCIQLRNKVDLHAEILFEKVHQFKSSLIGEINKYEKESIQSFKSTKRVQNTDKLLGVLSKFHKGTSDYMNGFKIEDNVERRLNVIDSNFSNKVNTINLNKLIKDYESHMCLLRLDNGNYVAFYIAQNSFLNYKTFNQNGDLISNLSGTLITTKVERMCVTKMGKMFVLSFGLAHDYNYFFVNDQKMSCYDSSGDEKDTDFVMIINEHFRFIKCIPLYYELISSNKSNIVCVESYEDNDEPDFLLLNTHLVTVNSEPKESIMDDDEVVDLRINDSLMFVLCDENQLRIFDLQTFDPVKVMTTNANRIEFMPMNRLVLYDAVDQSLRLYDQSADFKKIASYNFDNEMEDDLELVCDKTNRYSFYNHETVIYSNDLDLLIAKLNEL